MVQLADASLRIAGHTLHLDTRRLVRADGSPVEMRPQAMELLVELARHPGALVTKQELQERIWPGVVVTDDSLVQAVGDIRRAIDDQRHEVLQTLPRRGYRLIAEGPITKSPELNTSLPASQQSASKADRRRLRAGWLIALVALTLVAAALLVARPWSRGDGSPLALSEHPPIAVLDFADPGAAPEEQQIARGYAEELVGELARNADLRVVAANSSLDAAAPGEGLMQVAQRLRVGYLITGSLRRNGETLRLLANLVDGRDGRIVWSEGQDVAASRVHELRQALVKRVAITLRSTLRGNEERVAYRRPPASLDVYQMSLRAIALKHRFTPKESREALALLKRVIELDPLYAPAWNYLGQLLAIDSIFELNAQYDVEQIRTGIRHVEHAIELDRNLAYAHFGLSWMYAFAERHDDAVAAGRRCLELAPSDADCMMMLAEALVYNGQVEEALALARHGFARYPNPPPYILDAYATVMWANGLIEDALASSAETVRMVPLAAAYRWFRAIVLVEAGRIDEAKAELRELERRLSHPLTADSRFVRATWYSPVKAQSLIARRQAAARKLGIGGDSESTAQ